LVNLIIIFFAVIVVQSMFRRDVAKGVAAGMFFLVLLPTEVRIQMPGSVPELTGHRVVLLVLFFKSLHLPNRGKTLMTSRLVLLLCLVAVCRLFSSVNAVNGLESLKTAVGFLIEDLLFFVVMVRFLQDRRTVQVVAWGCLAALFVIACLATVEKYRGINLAAEFIPGMSDDAMTVSATFRHRILLGYAMAMGLPLTMLLQQVDKTKMQRRLVFASLLLIPAACYFSNSRGPWVGCAIGAVTMGAIGGQAIRKKLRFLSVLVALVLVARPGVLDTITDLWSQTFDNSSVKGRSADYRKVLWTVAWKELSKSPDRLAVGYGGHSTETMDLGEYFESGAGGEAAQLGYTSWDSQLAADLMQYGFLGFGFELILYGSLLTMLIKVWRKSKNLDQIFVAACIATVLIYFWALTNVAIFNPQLDFLFWGLAAIGISYYSFESLPEKMENPHAEFVAEAAATPVGSFQMIP
jgi:hypothetical protein